MIPDRGAALSFTPTPYPGKPKKGILIPIMDDASNTTGLATTDNRPLPVEPGGLFGPRERELMIDLLDRALRYYHANCMYIPEDYERPLFPLAEIEEFLGVTWKPAKRSRL